MCVRSILRAKVIPLFFPLHFTCGSLSLFLLSSGQIADAGLLPDGKTLFLVDGNGFYQLLDVRNLNNPVVLSMYNASTRCHPVRLLDLSLC